MKLTALLRIFYETGLSYLPVTETGAKEKEVLIGFLSRRLIDKELADAERAVREYDLIPDRLLIRHELPEILLETVKSGKRIPVYDTFGRKKAEWDAADLLSNWKIFSSSKKSEVETPADTGILPEKKKSSDDGAWLAGAVLATLDYPLFVSDLEGNTLFHNSLYEERILSHSAFKRNQALAETFFLELNRSLLAQHLAVKHIPGQTESERKTWIESLGCMMEVKDLYIEDFLSGYVYSFFYPGDTEFLKEAEVWLESGKSLAEILEYIESHIIHTRLEKYGQNVSHAAAALQMSRSTLQSRIKMLRIDERFGRKSPGPVRRNRGAAKMPEGSPAKKNSRTGISSARKKKRVR